MLLMLVAVGKPKVETLQALSNEYQQRLSRLGISTKEQFVMETQAGKQYSDAHVREREAEALTHATPPRLKRIALDPRGKSMSSTALAHQLEKFQNPGCCFFIGGSLGLSESFVQRCDLSLSLSSLTFTHEWARAMLWEQCYRAITIQRGLPYHK